MFGEEELEKNYYLLKKKFISCYTVYNLSRFDICRFVRTLVVRNNCQTKLRAGVTHT